MTNNRYSNRLDFLNAIENKDFIHAEEILSKLTPAEYTELTNIYIDESPVLNHVIRNFNDNEKILITGTSFKKEIVWSEITQMNVSKKDFMAWDRIELEIVYGDKSLTLNEDVEGWNEFVIKVKELFTSIPHDWDTIIIHLPFETNFKTIYSKACPPKNSTAGNM